MPCDSEYLNPTKLEKELQHTAILAKYLLDKLGEVVPGWISKETDNYYASQERVVPFLCDRIKALSKKEVEAIIYNPHDKKARQLADWWERHQEADQHRIAMERLADETESTKQAALKKLTPKERKALGL